MKSQSLIIQFLLFFLIGISIFISISQIFSFHSGMVKRDIISSSVKLSNSFISSAVITAVDNCKECDFVKISTNLGKATGYFIIASLENGLNTSTPTGDYFFSSIHNLNKTVGIQSSKVSSLKPITLTFNRTKNNLVIFQ